ncbi:hypothetical protein JQV19_07535 [Sulfitobacter mediterraneus]|uniref:hypothetical protein n=1 Tax=Sulfitobacter mediterraneus TaxID=83219 RepID=UPI0019394F19|nr:hypothetical protein [Sulfitobacter mediterraneus]MBM1556504.1 hypothetical protein [Sulfitobacter mediterraneus]MBM1567457.1 hypothetical protein [Sulfitobacter mediterraneus]MBM1571858.1 hypothetical protein [Sulfitobacter mediterraneus]MBM1575647.1 hypothetical protein [Sulfitobacter mediterraneus]MBM1578863.1 hypothetical protein [Sulfitobacter mediterraneus]
MPNGFAYLMLLIWPLVCLWLFRKMPLQRALIWSILGGYLFLPPLAEFNLPLVPSMDKVSIPNLSVVLILMFSLKEKLHIWPQGWIGRVLVAGLVLSAIPTVMTNRDPILFEVLRDADPIIFLVDQLPGQSVRDVGAVVLSQVLTLVPFLLARQFLADEKGLHEVLLAFMVGGLIYSIPSLFEIQFSPVTNIWIYGFFQHSFEQMIRDGGYRPIVFLPHGLWLAIFVVTSLIAAAALVRNGPAEKRFKGYLIVGYLAVLLVLCKSLASFAYGVALTPVALFIPSRWQIRLAVFFAVVAVGYPMLRNLDVVPTEAILAQAAEISDERAQSLAYRFNNEDQLLVRAAEKPAFGWGGWGRSLVRHSETGDILTVPDGRWIIVFGTFGWVGYICEFGLLALPLLMMGLYVSRRRPQTISPFVAPLCLILGVTLMDMLLNATLTPLTWLTAGAIMGHAEKLFAGVSHPPRYQMGSTVFDKRRQNQGKRTVL